jgi:hypothetical protein
MIGVVCWSGRVGRAHGLFGGVDATIHRDAEVPVEDWDFAAGGG